MTFVIGPGCCNDTSCIAVCPVQCIRPRPDDPNFTTAEQLYIDPATCIDCGACMVECPVDAISPDYDLPEQLAEFLDVNADYFKSNPIQDTTARPAPQRLLPQGGTLRVAIVGAGPAACYAAIILAKIRGVEVTVFERLPTPYGLVRAGVAPDHPQTKLIAETFQAALSNNAVTCFFNVQVGRDISVEELLLHHHALIWAGGAEDDRRLGIVGEELAGSHSAREFVAWYNGHPEHHTSDYTLDGERAVVIGNGNVAVDVARVLAAPTGHFDKTDMADHALEALRRSEIREVVVVGRRGPEHAAFSTGELLALDRMDGVELVARPDEVDTSDLSGRRREVLHRAAARQSASDSGCISLRYHLTPVAINGEERVSSVTFERPDGTTEVIETSLVLRAIGYRGKVAPTLPFDNTTGTIPNEHGRVVDPDTHVVVDGVYCAGWIKRGATGVIGTNRTDAEDTIDALFEDVAAGKLTDPAYDASHLRELIVSRRPDAIDGASWQRINEVEMTLGKPTSRPRVKLVTVSELLAASRGRSG